MSTEYIKTSWQDGDIITADKMNNIENGVKGIEEDIATVKDGLTSVATGDPINVYPTFQLGYLHDLPNYTPANPGHNVANNVVCGTDYISVADAEKLYFDSSNYTLCICYYNENKEYQTYVGFVSAPNPYVLDTDYAYFVPELRKTDSSAFSDDIPLDKLWYSGQVYNADIVRHGEFNNALASIETEISNIGTKKIIHSDILPTLPYNVYRTIDGYMCDTPITGLDTSDWVTVYVDSANGLDTNDGTENNPVKTLTKAEYWMEKAGQQGKAAEIIIADGSVFYLDDLPSDYNSYYGMIMRTDGNAKVFAGKKGTWTASDNHYVSDAFTDLNIVGCVDTSTTDDYGLYEAMTPLDSESDVDSTENSYYVDNTNKIAYVHPKSGATTDDIVVMMSDKPTMRFSARNFVNNAFIYAKNIDFIGNGICQGKSNSSQSDTIKRTIYFDSCTFQHGCSNNVLGISQYTYVYMVNCVGGYSKYDVFNYHFTYISDPTVTLVVEVNCKGKEGGYYNGENGTSDQISTCHEGANILRCNTHGYNADGSLIADVNGCYSVNLDCTVLNTSYTSAPGRVYAPYRFDNSSATRDGKTIMQNCYGYDSRNSKFVTAVDLTLNGLNYGGTIEATSLKVGGEMIQGIIEH